MIRTGDTVLVTSMTTPPIRALAEVVIASANQASLFLLIPDAVPFTSGGVTILPEPVEIRGAMYGPGSVLVLLRRNLAQYDDVKSGVGYEVTEIADQVH